MLPSEIAALIQIREFAIKSIDNLNIKLSREEVKHIQLKTVQLDKEIIQSTLQLDLEAKQEVKEAAGVSVVPAYVTQDALTTALTAALKEVSKEVARGISAAQSLTMQTLAAKTKTVKHKFETTSDITSMKVKDLDKLVKHEVKP